MTQQALAEASGLSKVWISRIERGKASRPGARALDQIAKVLGSDVIPPIRGSSSDGSERSPFNVVGRVDGDLRAREVRLLPVYRWGAAGDPRDAESSPDPDHEEYPPLGKETLIGANGFGVLVRGESMAGRDIHDGDTVWVNPDKDHRVGRPVLARVWNEEGDCGMVVKTLRRNEDGSLVLYSECRNKEPHPARQSGNRFTVIGPIVGISPSFKVPA